jgi:hypothetical protein
MGGSFTFIMYIVLQNLFFTLSPSNILNADDYNLQTKRKVLIIFEAI